MVPPSPAFCEEFNKVISMTWQAHMLYTQEILASISCNVFQSCLATWKIPFPCKTSGVFHVIHQCQHLAPGHAHVLLLFSHLWSKRKQGFPLKKHIQILPQPVSPHMGNWINNSRPPLVFLFYFYLSCKHVLTGWFQLSEQLAMLYWKEHWATNQETWVWKLCWFIHFPCLFNLPSLICKPKEPSSKKQFK